MISIDPQVFIIRGGKDHHEYGDSYTFSMTAVRTDCMTIDIRGLVGSITIKDLRDIEKEFNKIGIDTFTWERKDVHTKGNEKRSGSTIGLQDRSRGDSAL